MSWRRPPGAASIYAIAMPRQYARPLRRRSHTANGEAIVFLPCARVIDATQKTAAQMADGAYIGFEAEGF